MSDVTLARPYAKAAFEFARDQKVLDQWARGLSTLSLLVVDDKVKKLLASPNKTSEQKHAAFCALCSEDVDEKLSNFLAALSKNNRLSLLPQIQSLFLAFKSNYEKTLDVTVTTAYELSDALKEKLTKALKAKLARDVLVDTKIDDALVGGAIIRAGDTVIDGSVKGRLAKLTEMMNA